MDKLHFICGRVSNSAQLLEYGNRGTSWWDLYWNTDRAKRIATHTCTRAGARHTQPQPSSPLFVHRHSQMYSADFWIACTFFHRFSDQQSSATGGMSEAVRRGVGVVIRWRRLCYGCATDFAAHKMTWVALIRLRMWIEVNTAACLTVGRVVRSPFDKRASLGIFC